MRRSTSMMNRNGRLAAAAAVAALSGWASAQVDVGPQVRIDVAGGTFAANETTMAASDGNPLEIVGAWNDWRRSGGNEVINMGVALTLNGGVSWTDFLVRPPQANQSGVEGDPMTAADPRTGYLWVGAISFAGNGGIYVARKAPGAQNFEASVMARTTGGADKCWMAAGRAHDNPNATRVYIAYNEGVITSTDMGQTWGAPRSLGSGIGFLPRVGPNGEVYVAYWDFGNGVLMRRSLDGGTTFGNAIRIATRLDTWGTQDGSRFPGNMRVPPMNYIAVDPNDGTLYCIYFDTTNRQNNNYNVDLYFCRSTDRGDTWTTPRVINGDGNPPGDQFWPWFEVDAEGRLHLTFFDSRHTNQNDNTTNGMFDNYYAISEDRGDSWIEFRLTPNSWNCNNDGLNRGQQFIGDYNGLAVAGDVVYPCYLSTQNGDPDIFTNIITVGGEPQPGACCFRDGSCADLLREDCAAQGGTWRFGTNCGAFSCPQPGACCLNDEDCASLIESECLSSGGTFLGEGADCRNACPCDAIKKFRARCKDNGEIVAKVVYRDNSHDGEFVTISVDSQNFNVIVLNGKAKLFACCYTGGHTVRLVDPGCFDPIDVGCP